MTLHFIKPHQEDFSLGEFMDVFDFKTKKNLFSEENRFSNFFYVKKIILLQEQEQRLS